MLSRRGFIKTGILTGTLTLLSCKSPAVERVSGSGSPPAPKPPDPVPPRQPASPESGMREEFTQRLVALQRLLTEARIGCLFLTPSTNLYYLSGIKLSRSERLVALLIPSRGDPVMVCPSFEAERIPRRGIIPTVRTWEEDEDPYQRVREVLVGMKAASRSIGIEPTTEFETYTHLRRVAPAASLVNGAAILDRLRMIKSPRELDLMRQAIDGTTRAINKVLPTLTSGLLETEVAQEIRAEMRRLGGEGGGLVQFGPNSAIPHAGPSDRKLAPRDVVLLDVGMRVEGYISDITRTSLYKERNPEVEKIYEIVLRAQRAGQAAANPGVICEEVDAAARRVIAEAGYDKYFTHRLGHGLGLDGHEKPYLVHGNKTPLQSGMIITIEPGIYLPGKFGVRIEDDFVITEDGCKPLSTLESSLRLI